MERNIKQDKFLNAQAVASPTFATNLLPQTVFAQLKHIPRNGFYVFLKLLPTWLYYPFDSIKSGTRSAFNYLRNSVRIPTIALGGKRIYHTVRALRKI